ncbi:hypothetical protein SALBM135S_09771 [Streptomyces alboniger]
MPPSATRATSSAPSAAACGTSSFAPTRSTVACSKPDRTYVLIRQHPAKLSRRAAQEQAAKRAAEHEARRPVRTGCGAKFTDERREAAQGQAKAWGTPKDSRPHLCDSCRHAAVADTHEADDRQERPEPLPDWAEPKHFLRCARRPRCTECRAAFTDERWQAAEHTGWDALPPPPGGPSGPVREL